MNKKTFFCSQLASWFCGQQWHFKTLLAAAITNVEPLPDDMPALISRVFICFSEKPAENILAVFLQEHTTHWFYPSLIHPKVRSLNLQPYAHSRTNACLPLLNTSADLARWLNLSNTQLDWLADLRRYESRDPEFFRHYHYSVVAKKSGESRLIESPKTTLKTLQRKIKDEIISCLPVHVSAHGFCRNKSCQTHAAIHTNKAYVFLFDLRHCFHSIQWPVIYSLFMSLGYPRSVVRYLAGLCMHATYSDHEYVKALPPLQKTLLRQRHLPQGAPSSPALLNAALFRLDQRLMGLATKMSFNYSRYGDDLAFSGNHYRNKHRLEALIGPICLEEGVSLNHRKSRLLKAHQRQQITSVIVNKKVNVDRRYYDKLKAILTNCIRYGVDSQNRDGHANFRQYLLGSIAYVKSLNRQKGENLARLFRKINR